MTSRARFSTPSRSTRVCSGSPRWARPAAVMTAFVRFILVQGMPGVGEGEAAVRRTLWVVPILCAAAAALPAQPDPGNPTMTREQASGFARLALKGVRKEYPNKPADVLNGPADVPGPEAAHPAFYGSFDWHSSVHGHWMLIRLLKVFTDLPVATEVRAALGENLTAANLRDET